jgi:hypothetical protein
MSCILNFVRSVLYSFFNNLLGNICIHRKAPAWHLNKIKIIFLIYSKEKYNKIIFNCYSDLVNFTYAINNWFSRLLTKLTFMPYLTVCINTLV